MNWKTAEKVIETCKDRFHILKQEYNLRSSTYLVVDYGRGQAKISEFALERVAIEHKELFQENSDSLRLIQLIEERDELLKQIESVKGKKSHSKSYLCRQQVELESMEKEIQGFDKENLELTRFTIELRFSTLDIDLVQKLKRSEFCDTEKTDPSKASIRVVLKMP